MHKYKYRQNMLALGLMTPVLAFAAGEPASDDIIEQIIVTAQKRATALQDVPFSVAAASEEQIRNSGSTNIVDLARNFAGLTIADLGPGQSQVAIRGISAGQVIRDQPGVKEQVGIYLDESPISIALFTPDLELYDLDRFEVLRGPQGTLFGAGSLSGTLRYITTQPKIGEFEGSAEVSALQGSDTSFGGSIKGAINLPMGNTAAMRIVGYYDQLPGFIDARRLDGSVDEDVDSGDKTGARVALTFEPSEGISITPRIVYQKLDTDGFPRIDVYNILANPFTTTQPAVTLGDREQFVQLEEGLEDDFKLADLTMEFGLGELTLTSVTSYTDREVVVTRDATSLTGSVSFDLGSPNAVRLSSALIDTTDLQALSQELRLASNSGGQPFEWLVGAFYQDVDRDYSQFLPTPGWDAATGLPNGPENNSVPDSPFFSGLTYDFQQFALFGEGTYHFNPQWSLTAGVRYYDFEEDRVLNFGGQFAAPTFDLPGSTSSDGFSPRAILEYDVTPDVQLTAQVSRGFRLGGINDPINLPLCSPQDILVFGNQQTFEDETALNYELGAKTQFADRRVTFNAAAFYADIEDLQATTDAGTCSSRIVFNVPKARSIGVEAELFARPSDNWDFGISATWVDAELRSSVTSTSAAGVTSVISGLGEGKRLPTAPEFQAVASVGYATPFRDTLDGFFNLTLQYVGSSFSQFGDNTDNFGIITTREDIPGAARLIPFGDPSVDTITFNPELPSYEIGNLRVGVRNDQWEAALFVNNLWDERAFLAVDRERGRSARVGYITNMPRTYGVMLRMNF